MKIKEKLKLSKKEVSIDYIEIKVLSMLQGEGLLIGKMQACDLKQCQAYQ